MIKIDKRKAVIFFSALVLDALGPRNALINVLITVIVLDYATGLLRAGYECKMNSLVGAKGIIKKIGYLVGVALAHQIDLWLHTGDAFRAMSISLFIANETWSNIENLAVLGIVFPKSLLGKIKEMMDPEQLIKNGKK